MNILNSNKGITPKQQASQSLGNSYISGRALIIDLCIQTGGRINEILHIRLTDLVNDTSVNLYQSKTNTYRLCTLNQHTYNSLYTFLQTYKQLSYIVSYTNIYNYIKRTQTNNNMIHTEKNYQPLHQFRKLYIRNLRQKGMSIQNIATHMKYKYKSSVYSYL